MKQFFFRRAMLAACALVVVSAAIVPANAQTLVTLGSIAGLVADSAGGVLPGATVTAMSRQTAQTQSATAAGDGRYRFPPLPPGEYRVVASLAGFADAARTVTVAAGQTLDVPLVLGVAGVVASVSVSADAPIVDLTRTQVAEVVAPREIQNLPLNGRNFLDLALLTGGASRTNTRSTEHFAETSAVPGTGLSLNGQRNSSNTFLVDGLSANDDASGLAGAYLSEEVIREFQVVNAGGIAQFGRASAGAVSVITQSGTGHWRSRLYGYGRNSAFDAMNALATRKIPFTQSQYGATVGGPLRPERLFAFGNFEQTRQHTSGFVTIDPANVAAIDEALDRTGYRGPRVATGPFPTGYDSSNLFGKIDSQSRRGQMLLLRYGFYHLASANARNAGGLNDVSRATGLVNTDHSLAMALVSPLSSRLLNEVRVQVVRSRLAAPVNDGVGPAVNIAGIASFGTATFSPTFRSTDSYEAIDNVSWQRGTHLLKGGASLLWNRETIVFPGATQGVYTFSSLGNFRQGRYITFQQAFGNASQFQSNPNLGVFAQDEWQLRQSVTVNVGLRCDVQWITSPVGAMGATAPRLGVAWAPGSHRTVLRASFGTFYDRVPLRATSNALQRDGINYRIAVLPFGHPGAPVFPAVLSGYPSDVLTAVTTVDAGLAPASTRQVGIQAERQLADGVSVAATFTHLDGRDLLLSRNVNVPTLTAAQAAALGVPNLGRPDPRFGNINRLDATGTSRYDGLTASLNLRSARWGSLRASYTLSRAMDDAGNFFFSAPQDSSEVHADWGPSDNDQRHRLVISGTHEVPRGAGQHGIRRMMAGWRMSYIFSYASALPFNLQTGTDRNNDTTVNDRPAGIGRNSARGEDQATLDLRIGRRFTTGSRLTIEMIADAFNVLNRANFQIPNNVFGTGSTPLPTFGVPTAAGDPRQLQFGMRVNF